MYELARFAYVCAVSACSHTQAALSASSPFYRGLISDIDVRWQVISASVDDRTEEEQGVKPLKKNK